MVNKYRCRVSLGSYNQDVLSDNKRGAEEAAESNGERRFDERPRDAGQDIRLRAECELVEEDVDEDAREFEFTEEESTGEVIV